MMMMIILLIIIDTPVLNNKMMKIMLMMIIDTQVFNNQMRCDDIADDHLQTSSEYIDDNDDSHDDYQFQQELLQ